MTIHRVALIFDSVLRPETAGVYCHRALERLVAVEHFQPHDLDRVPRQGFDLYLNIDDGLRYHLPPELRPSAFWAIDTHLDFDRCREKAPRFDVVFAPQRDGVDLLRGIGVNTASWLPLACDPEIHRKHDLAKQYDVAFVGNISPGPRADLLALIQRRYRNSFVGNCYFDDMARTYSSARIAFNRSIRNDVNMRVFEAVGCGSLLMTNDLGDNGLAELLRDGVHLATYREPQDLLDKLAFYLDREAIRERIAAAGRAEAIAKHTYAHRMEKLLKDVEAALSRTVVQPGAGNGGSSWSAEPTAPTLRLFGAGLPTFGAGLPTTPQSGPQVASFGAGLPTFGAGLPTTPHPGSEVSPPLPTAFGAGLPTTPGPEPQVSPPQLSEATPNPFYFGHARPEVLALIPETARRVLDIGCGAGRLGEAIKQRQEAIVSGIEFDAKAAAAARQRLDQVWAGDVEQLDLKIPPGSFDAIVCADVLEHLREPYRLLRQAREWLSPGGSLIASIPNVRHHSVVRSLLQGNWTYEPAGLLDRTHLRFFTGREIEKLFHRAGFAIEGMWSVNAPGDDPTQRNRSGPVQLGRLSIDGLSPPEADEFYTYQFLIRAQPAPAPDSGLTSIVIVTHNEVEFTWKCLDSIRLVTDEPYELIVVDNASTDGTVEFLRAFPDMHVIVNDTNRGFPAAANQGMAVSSRSQVLLLNNDVVVTTGWLGRMLRALRSDPKVGLVGPTSNCVSGPQQIEVGYDALADLDGFAWDRGKLHNGFVADVNRLVGFCLLIRREVIESIGLLDEQFGIGCFEDDDYCLRAIAAGYRAVIAGDAFVHHYGGRTFLGSGVDANALMRENQRRFRDKWSGNGEGTDHQPAGGQLPAVSPGAPPHPARGHPVPGGARDRGPFAVDVAPGGGLRLRRHPARPKLSLIMIVRDCARTLPACLESIRPWVDEMIVVDTGSVDETERIVESFEGKLFHFPWCDDFSAARNESLRHATGESVFWMDADDTIPLECGRGLRSLVYSPIDPSVLGFVVKVHCPVSAEHGGGVPQMTIVDHVKLFRNRPELRFDRRIHEQVLGPMRRLGGQVVPTNLYVVHSGADQSPAGQRRKCERDLRILKLELAEQPDHTFTLFNLGMTCSQLADVCEGSPDLWLAEAADYLRRSIRHAAPQDSHVRKAFALLVSVEMRRGNHEKALEACRQGRALLPCDVELCFFEGRLLHEMGRLEEAWSAYLRVLAPDDEWHLTSIDRDLKGFKVHQNLAAVAECLGNLAEARRQWVEVVRDAPHYRHGWQSLGQTLIKEQRFADADTIADGLMTVGPIRAEGLLLKSRLAVAQERLDDARAIVEATAAEYPDDLPTLRHRCEVFVSHGTVEEGERALRSLIDHDPRDAEAHRCLGATLMRSNRRDEAIAAYRQSLRYRTNHALTYQLLGIALQESGRFEEAAAAWGQAARVAPKQQAPRRELRQLGAR